MMASIKSQPPEEMKIYSFIALMLKLRLREIK